MLKNVAGQVVSVVLENLSDGTPCTTGTTNVFFTGDTVAQAGSQLGPLIPVHMGNGQWNFYPTQGETNYDHVSFLFYNTLARPVLVEYYPFYSGINSVLAQIGSGDFTFSGPTVNDLGDFTIIQGDDYYIADGRSINFTIGASPDLTGATVVLKIKKASGFISSSSTTILTPGTSSQTVEFELSSTNTALLAIGSTNYDVEATLADGHVVTLNNPAISRCIVVKQVV